jgi:hypothetical protein
MISRQRRYDIYPSVEDQPGDIWSSIPFSGCDGGLTNAVVISPACDLANCKAESLTLLPLISVREYVTSFHFLRETTGALQELLSKVRIPGFSQSNLSLLPNVAEITRIQDTISERADSDAERIGAGLQLIESFRTGSEFAARFALLEELMGRKKLEKHLEDIVLNRRLSTHFFPDDTQIAAYSAVPQPSVALLRAPMAYPLEVFEAANLVSEERWGEVVIELAPSLPAIKAFESARPLKRARLETRFTSDLLTRFVSLYVRLGAPDLTNTEERAAVEKIFGG